MEQLNYYAVGTKCGHVGRNNYINIIFGVCAETGREAAKIARYIPRVKHDRKDAISFVEKIDYDEYNEIILKNESDLYLQSSNIQEQRINCSDIADRIHREKDDEEYERRIYHPKYDRNKERKHRIS